MQFATMGQCPTPNNPARSRLQMSPDDDLGSILNDLGSDIDAASLINFLRDVCKRVGIDELPLPVAVNKQHIYELLLSVTESTEVINWMKGLKGTDAVVCVRVLDKVATEAGATGRRFGCLLDIIASLCTQMETLPPLGCSVPINVTDEDLIDVWGYSMVYKGLYNSANVAVKILRTSDRSRIQKRNEHIEHVVHEVVFWKYLQHPNINPPFGAHLPTYQLISPWVDNGNLYDYTDNFRDANRLRLLVDIASGLEYLHGLDLVHGDLKFNSVLVTKYHRACLTSTSLTRSTSNPRKATSESCGNNMCMIVPELWDPEQFGEVDAWVTKKCDIYAMSMIMYEMLTGGPPWPDISILRIAVRIIKGKRPPLPSSPRNYTDDIFKLMEQCWDQYSENRPHISEVIERLKRAAEAPSN